jgi:hypothetical protein
MSNLVMLNGSNNDLNDTENDLDYKPERKLSVEIDETDKGNELESNINKISFLMFGIGMLLPWNAMLAAMDFFTSEFPSYKPDFSLLVAVSVPMLGV